MKKVLLPVAIVMTVLAQGVCRAETNATPPGKVIALINAGAVSPELLAQLEKLARQSLKVSFETVTIPKIETTNLLSVVPQLKKDWKANYAAMVAIVTTPTSVTAHASFNTNESVSVVNATAMSTEDAEVYRKRMLKQIVRGAAFAIGLKPSRDPLCVSRDYRTVGELDSMPIVLFPPWQSNFARLAGERGIVVEKPKFPPNFKAPPAPPAPPAPGKP